MRKVSRGRKRLPSVPIRTIWTKREWEGSGWYASAFPPAQVVAGPLPQRRQQQKWMEVGAAPGVGVGEEVFV